ncbi:MAG TPA: hypothetical protein VLF66_00115, partial [Thermoanaerobaculia bacterium]|nr:hypothetical protein [Thermoanaerobaculia bacterium]
TPLVAAGGRLVFAGLDAGGRWQLWSTDGTAPGTRPLATLDPGERPGPAHAVGARAYVVTRRPGATLRLWTSDGTVAGTRAVAPLGGARRLEDVASLAAAGGRLYLSLFTAAIGQELWTSDGTAAGTRPVADLWPGPRGSWPTALTPAGSFLAFAAEDPAGGREPWLTDGTARGTVRLADVAPGPAGSAPLAFGVLSDTLYFDADDGETGRELWSVRLVPSGAGPGLPPPVDATPLPAPELPGFRVWVRITVGEQVLPTRREPCIPETVCASGSVRGRSELFVRIVGPKPNGRLWPTLVRFSTSTIEVWIEQVATGELRYYRLEGATPGSSDLGGLFDRQGFAPPG